jgi:hypothetical protein
MINAHAEQRQPQNPIPTCSNSKVLGLKIKWHSSIRSIRNNILRWDIRNYREYTTEWDWVLRTLTWDLEMLYTYSSFPLCRSYLSKYLAGTISDDRKEWKKFYFETGQQHKNMPDAAFNAWQPWWVSEEGRAKCQQMKDLCTLKTLKPSTSTNPTSSSGGSPPMDHCSSQHLPSPVQPPSPQVFTIHSYMPSCELWLVLIS